MLSDLHLSRHHTLYEEQRHPSSGSAWPACPQNGKSGSIAGDGGFATTWIRCDSSPACRLCRLEPGILVCSWFLISVCMFIVSKALLISSATVIARTW